MHYYGGDKHILWRGQAQSSLNRGNLLITEFTIEVIMYTTK